MKCEALENPIGMCKRKLRQICTKKWFSPVYAYWWSCVLLPPLDDKPRSDGGRLWYIGNGGNFNVERFSNSSWALS